MSRPDCTAWPAARRTGKASALSKAFLARNYSDGLRPCSCSCSCLVGGCHVPCHPTPGLADRPSRIYDPAILAFIFGPFPGNRCCQLKSIPFRGATSLIGLSKYWGIHPIRAFYLSTALIYSRMQLPRSYDHLSLPSTSALSLLLVSYHITRVSMRSNLLLFALLPLPVTLPRLLAAKEGSNAAVRAPRVW